MLALPSARTRESAAPALFRACTKGHEWRGTPHRVPPSPLLLPRSPGSSLHPTPLAEAHWRPPFRLLLGGLQQELRREAHTKATLAGAPQTCAVVPHRVLVLCFARMCCAGRDPRACAWHVTCSPSWHTSANMGPHSFPCPLPETHPHTPMLLPCAGARGS